jgi:23S rRNA (cytosine1962-C5)-methyltransferase
MQNYELIDSGNGRKLERFGPYTLSRPSSQAVWKPCLGKIAWDKASALFIREGDTKWSYPHQPIPSEWTLQTAGLIFKISPTEFGHLGIFPEQQNFWSWIQNLVAKSNAKRGSAPSVLNLFAYSGGSTLAAAKSGARVCHLDASKGMVAWARENAQLNHLETAPIRWIVDDVTKFLLRESKRGNRYDAIILDPPTFGRGSNGEIFKIEDSITQLLAQCRQLLSENPLFVLFSCHTPGFTPIVMQHLLSQMMHGKKGLIDYGEMLLTGNLQTLPLPSGSYARWIDEQYV